MDRPACLLLLLGLAACAASPSAEQLRASRAMNLERLRAYALRGEFPRNEHFPGERMPYFVDRHGTPCAVAHLMIEDGWGDAVRKIATRDNPARIGDIREGPLLEWIRASGLTQEECALIQPPYRRPVTTEAVVQVTWAGAATRVDPNWIIPAWYRNRPHLPERQRVRSHLLDVVESLEASIHDRPAGRAYRWVEPPRIVVLEDTPAETDERVDPEDVFEAFAQRFNPWVLRRPDRRDPSPPRARL